MLTHMSVRTMEDAGRAGQLDASRCSLIQTTHVRSPALAELLQDQQDQE